MEDNMEISNAKIADIFTRLAEFLEIQGYNPYKIRAYQNAATEIKDLGFSIAQMVKRGEDISKLPSIGSHIAKKIVEIVTTGKLSKLEELQKKYPPHILDLFKVEGIGPKRARVLYNSLHISSLEELLEAAKEHKIRQLPGFSDKLEEKILDKTLFAKKIGRRFLYSVAKPHADAIVEYMQTSKDLIQFLIAGSFRRCKDTVGDLDSVATSKSPQKVIDYFTKYPEIKEVLLHGYTRSTVILKCGIQVDFRCVEEESYGSALHYFTGSRAHVLALRKLALKRDLKINEYGIFKGKQRIAGSSEDEVYKTMGFSYIEPELRENRGELEAAAKGELPELIRKEDIQGDLHIHTTYSDGQNSITQMAEAARELGLKYIAITDLFGESGTANSVDEKSLRAQMNEIDELNQKLKDITILKGAEVEILKDGSLAMEQTLLKELDLVVAAVHSDFKLSKVAQTKRVLKAVENPYVTILAHPTCRVINQKEPCSLDMEQLFKACIQRGCLLEINAQPIRLDLNDIYTKIAKGMGVKFAISTGSCSVSALNYMQYGVNQARRGWLEKKDVINTLSLGQLQEAIKSMA